MIRDGGSTALEGRVQGIIPGPAGRALLAVRTLSAEAQPRQVRPP